MVKIHLTPKKLVFIAGFGVIFFAVFSLGLYVGRSQAVITVSAPANVNFSLFWDAYNKLHESFINPASINEQKIIYGAIDGMTKSLQDPYTSFFDPSEAKLLQQDLAGSFEGIGIEVEVKKGQLVIVAPLQGTPGDKAGLKAGDAILKINGKNTSDTSTEEAVNLIRGKRGTSVTLTIFREGWTDTKDFTITRDTIKVPSIKWEIKNDNIAYIDMLQFDQGLSNDFPKIAMDIKNSPAKKIILDLRNNPGGYLDVARDVAGWFLQPGQVVTVEDFGNGKEKQEYKTDGNAYFANYPMVVLMNKGSASASEILAGALRDNRKIQLVGEKSFGKGSVQEVQYLQDDTSLLKITIARWLTPKGYSISEVGLAPDVTVTISDSDSEAKKDPQLEKALEIIETMP